MKEKDLVYKLWWLNIWNVVILLGSFVMLIVTPLCKIGDGYEALWATTFTRSAYALKKEAEELLKVFVSKFKKINGIKDKPKKKK